MRARRHRLAFALALLLVALCAAAAREFIGFDQVMLWDRAIIITHDPNFYREGWKLPVWHSVSAVRKKPVYLSPHLPLGWFDYPPGVSRLIGLLWLDEIPYPHLFHHDPRSEAGAPYRYKRELASAQLDALLGEPGVAPR